MPPQSRITCYTAWANVRCSSLSHQLNNVFTDLFTDIHLKSLLESFTGGLPQKLSSLAQHQTKRQLILQFKLFIGELQKAGIIPQNCNIDCGLISKKNTKSIDDLLWKLIVHDVRFTWERSSQLQLDSDKLICSVCFKWTPMVKSVLKQTRTPLSFFAGLETTLTETERSSVSILIESFSLQDIGPFPGREIAKALNKKIPSKGWNYYPSAVECILDLINTHLQADSKALCAYMCVIFMCGYKFRQSIAVINCIRELQHIANLLAAQLKTFPVEDLEPDQSAQKSDLEKWLEVTKNELSWLHASYDVPFCQNWSEHATDVQKQTQETISKKMTERFEMVIVPRNMSVNELCLSLVIAFTDSNGFYLAQEKETFPESRKLVLQNKKTKKFIEDFSGCQSNVSVRKLLKLPLTGIVEIDPNTYREYHLFFESNTRNRKLKVNTRFLYEVFPGTPGHWQRIFFQSVKNGDFEIVKNMIKFFKDKSPDIIHSQEPISGNGSLHLACLKGHFEIAQELLENGVSLDARDAMGSTPFFCAVEGQHRKICQLLIEWGCDVHAKNLKNNTAFDGIQSEEFRNFLLSYHAHWSSAIPLITQGDTNVLHNIVRSLLNRKNFMSSPTSRCINGSTLLHAATYFGRTDIVKILLHLKIDVNLQDYKGATALHRARDTDTIQLLTDHGADVNWSDGDGNTPLHMMSYGELTKPARLDCLKLLLSQKATIGSLNKKDLLPIHCAAMQGRIDVIQLLLQFDTEEQIISKLMAAKAPSILYLSVANNHVECAQWLTEKGFSFKPDEQEELLFGLLQDEMGVQGKVQCLEFLIRNGVDINAVDKQGESALHLAACRDNCNDLLMLLLANNAEVNTLNRDHSTPLFHAVQASNYYGASLLIQHGVNIKKANNQGFRAFDLIQDYQEWIESGFFTNEIISLLKAYELDRSCSLVRNINMKLKMVEASQKLPVFNSQLKQSSFWFKT